VDDRLRKNPQLSDKMRVAWLGEDNIFTGLIDFALEIADELSREYPDEFNADYREKARPFSGDDAAELILREILSRLGDKNILLIMENLNRAFHGLRDSGQKKWRAFLQEHGRVATLASSQQLFEGISSRDAAFYGFFEIVHLEPLSVDDARELMAKIARETGKQDLVRFLATAEGRYRVRALHHLAGGNHRMYVMLSEFLTRESLDGLIAAFEQLAEDLTPYFQERVGALPPQQARIVQSLCNATGAMTVKAISEDTFISDRNVSRQLGDLKQKGYVTSEKRGKESFYEMAEPLMRLCLEVKKQRGKPLRLVAAFLRAWYSAKSLTSGELSVESIRRAFAEGDTETSEYGGAPRDILRMVMGREPDSWAEFIEAFVPIYAQHGALSTLASGLSESIAALDSGGYSDSQLDLWNSNWQRCGAQHDELSIALSSLNAAVQVIKTRNDRPLFALPAEIREIVRPLLNHSLSTE